MQIYEKLLPHFALLAEIITEGEQCLIKYDYTKFFASHPINIILKYYTHTYYIKSLYTWWHHSIIFIHFLNMVKIANYLNETIIIIILM